MTIRSSLHFTFNGRRSDEFGIMNVNMESGLQSEPFAANRSVKEQRVRGRDRGYFQEIELDKLKFSVSFAWENGWENEDKIREAARWLLSPQYYAPMIFAEQMDRIYYCICVDSPELLHNSMRQGYIRLNFECIDAYTYTPVYEKSLDLSNNSVEGTIYTFENFGDAACKPQISIYKVGNGSIGIFNQSDGNTEMTIKNLVNGETIEIDCENRIIESDIPLTHHYNDLQGDYLTIPVYNNRLLIKGKCHLRFKYQLKRLQ